MQEPSHTPFTMQTDESHWRAAARWWPPCALAVPMSEQTIIAVTATLESNLLMGFTFLVVCPIIHQRLRKRNRFYGTSKRAETDARSLLPSRIRKAEIREQTVVNALRKAVGIVAQLVGVVYVGQVRQFDQNGGHVGTAQHV